LDSLGELGTFFLYLESFREKTSCDVRIAVVDARYESVGDRSRKLANDIEIDVARYIVDEALENDEVSVTKG
jgi:CO dehydrogenase nickel-insertion accessory protein CooC1